MSNNKLFVHGFRHSVSLEDRKAMIINLFSQFGKIAMVVNKYTNEEEEAITFIPDRDRGDGYYKNFCFVEMDDEDGANAVIKNCEGTEFEGGIKLSISLATEKPKK
jgi:RNA recognition motif-containing protein